MNDFIKTVRDAIKATVIFVVQNAFFFMATDVTSMAAEGPILVIAPHPDDETLGCGALIARARQQGQKVRIVIVTDGGSALLKASHSMAELIVLRRKEAERAASILGVDASDVAFVNIPDTEADTHQADIETALRREVEMFAPNLVMAPYGIDLHEDHRAVAVVVEKLRREGTITCPVLEYPIWFWLSGALRHLTHPEQFGAMRRVRTKGFVAAKKKAMQAHHSQCPSILGGEMKDGFFQPLSFLIQYFARYELFFERASR